MSTAVLFDLDGTVFRYERSWRGIFEEALSDPPAGSIETFLIGYVEAIDEPTAEPYVRGFDRVAREHDVEVDPREAAKAYATAELAASTVPEDTEHVLWRVAERGPTGVVANGDGTVVRSKVERHGLLNAFDELVISTEVGVRKPDPEIFRMARDRFDADRFVYVGDSYESDIEPAENAGFTTVQVRNDAGPTVSVDTTGSIETFVDLG